MTEPQHYPETFCPKCNLSSKYNMIAPIGKTIDNRTIWKHFGNPNDSCGYEWVSPDRIEPTSKPIRPIGLNIIQHPKLNEWIVRGQASQESDGLWLHYSVVCTLIREQEK